MADTPLDELRRLVRIANHNYGTSLPVEVVQAAIDAGFTSIERMRQDALEDTRPCGLPGCDVCAGATLTT